MLDLPRGIASARRGAPKAELALNISASRYAIGEYRALAKAVKAFSRWKFRDNREFCTAARCRLRPGARASQSAQWSAGCKAIIYLGITTYLLRAWRRNVPRVARRLRCPTDRKRFGSCTSEGP